ncbi:ParB N-terminal domain-containing protein [Kitasatospora sp. NPDC005748]|uniref:ParB N-terminal domain-containing protein n=1 Tax=Kitasatospora sp. NPDC005748 TaxID=3157063 RepID=UPI0033E55295
MERAKIRLSDIRTATIPTGRIRDLDGLVSSIRTFGLKDPLLISDKDDFLLSGNRRYEASKLAHMHFVDAIFVGDIEEGAHELRRHLTNPDPIYSLPMTVTEKVATAFTLQRLPPPAGTDEGFRREVPAAAAVGLPTKVYTVLRSTLRKAEKEMSSPGTAGKAQKSLSLMVEAVERPALDYPLTSVVAKLHQLLLQGICPDTLESCFPYLNGKPGARDVGETNADHAGRAVPRARTSRRDYDYVRTADVVIGTLEGLSDVVTDDLATSEHFTYMLKALKDARRMSHTYVKKMEKMRNE